MRTAIRPTSLHFRRLASHFLALTGSDRFLRFGRLLGDVDIVAYVETLFCRADALFVVVEPAPDIVGAVHLELTECGTANLGLSVSTRARGKGIGTLLLERTGLYASSRGVSTLFVRNLGFNMALQRLAHRVGMKVACAPDTGSTRLELPTGHQAASVGKSLAGRITLADYFLRARCSAQPDLDSAPVEYLAPMHWILESPASTAQ